MTYKYEMAHKRHGEVPPDAYWQWADGGKVIETFVNHHGDRFGRLSLEDKLERVIDAMGRIADAAGIDLPALFEGELDNTVFRPNQNPGD